MKLTVETVIDTGGTEEAGWGLSLSANPVLMIVVGSRKVLVEMSPSDARDVGCAAICASNAAGLVRAEMDQRQATDRLVTIAKVTQ